MMQSILIGIAAGVAAALLFLAPESGSSLAFPLLALTALPIAIAGLGWGIGAGVVAAATGAAIVGVIVASLPAVAIFLALFAAPILWLARLAGMWRETGNGAGPAREWYPLGRLLLHAAIAVAVGLGLTGWIVGYDSAGFSGDVALAFNEVFVEMNPAEAPSPEAVRSFVDLYVALLPFTMGLLLVAITVVNLWLAALVARASGRFARPAEPLWMVTLPNEILAGFAVTLVLAFVLPGGPGQGAGVFAGAFGAALVLAGLAVLHAVTLGMSGRPFLLGLTYFLVVISGLPLIIVALIGAAENVFQFRARRFRRRPLPPSSPSKTE